MFLGAGAFVTKNKHVVKDNISIAKHSTSINYNPFLSTSTNFSLHSSIYELIDGYMKEIYNKSVNGSY